MEAAFATPNNPLAVLRPTKTPKIYSLEEYLRREEKAVERHEYLNGIISKIPMARGKHNEITANTVTAIKNALKNSPKKYRVFSGQQKIFLPKLNYGLYPDALVICESPIYYDQNEVLLLNPIAIVEVLSRSTRNYDRSEKFVEYKTLPSFKEYILIDQDTAKVETRFREDTNLWRDTFYSQNDEKVLLKSLDCSILMSDIYENIEF
jgi:Uma2 family endonuclease